jgi:predicted DNA-binding protein (MmcQ/YjbR family)
MIPATIANRFCHVENFLYYRLIVEGIVMNIESLREYCISKKFVTESFPFDEETLVFKASGKIFALVSLDDDLIINLKCDPDMAIELRERYVSVTPRYHMNKNHWNTIILDGTVPDKEIFSWIDHSYDLVMKRINS